MRWVTEGYRALSRNNVLDPSSTFLQGSSLTQPICHFNERASGAGAKSVQTDHVPQQPGTAHSISNKLYNHKIYILDFIAKKRIICRRMWRFYLRSPYNMFIFVASHNKSSFKQTG
ncbi:hypothetical protein CLV84_2010 [Neolewinella xylanilytica]|uniref:Uncharacterized protein n=1 Tax=Neolewinella xylanilytica TaxID=1514080 RepID=A0A2S6I207_9BACT|nr:hypothetical protein CLV84_2010 [Neolewinella xylanilytica]